MKMLRSAIIVFILSLVVLGCNRLSNADEKLRSELTENVIQESLISANRDTVVTGINGSKLAIQKNSFVDENGNKVTGNINLSVTEAIDLEEIIKEDISTITSNGGLLETRGMLKIEASQNGKALKLGNQKSLKVFFPKSPIENREMKLYYGSQNKEGITEWVIADGEEEINRSNRIHKVISIKHKIYNELVNDYLRNNSEAINYLDTLLTFTELERTNLLNKSIRIHWLLFADGDFEVIKIIGNLSQNKIRDIEKKLNEIPYILPFKREGDEFDMTGFIDIFFTENENFNSNDYYYVFNATQLGWVNCDIFIEMNVPKVNMIVESPANTTIKVSFKNYRTIVSGYKDTKGYIFYDAPEKEPIEIIAINNDNINMPKYSITATTVTDFVQINPLESIQVKDLKVVLDEIN